jgi:hypothetical protein
MKRERTVLSAFAIAMACCIAAHAAPTNAQPVPAVFRIPPQVDVSVIVIYAMEDHPERSPKFPMKVTMPKELTRITDKISISQYADLANAVRVTGTTRLNPPDADQLLARDPLWVIRLSGMRTGISPEERRLLSDGDISFHRYFRIYGNEIYEHHLQHPGRYLTEGPGVSNLVQFIRSRLEEQKKTDSHNNRVEATK